MGMFDINGRFFRGLTKAGDFFILGLLLVVFSIPVLTIGTSLTAAFYVALKSVRDEEGYMWKDFWKSWKQNLRQSILIELIIAVLAAILYVDIRVSYDWAKADGNMVIRLIMFAALGCMLVLVAVTLYVFPVLAKFENSVLKTLKNALILCMHHLPQTIVMLIITYGVTYFSLQYFTAFIVTIPLILYVDAYVLSRIFQQYVNKEGEDESSTKSDKENDQIED
jgi:uncharacterized membrane protein YesL